jgi:tetraacyldisaccharide 4'-kinase
MAPVQRLLYTPLRLLSVIYGLCLSLREGAYLTGVLHTREVSIPVISVGNITLGGTGKTPVVERISRELKKLGFNPGIITRGYRRKKKGVFHVDANCDDANQAGDEAFMLAKKTDIPVIVGNNRALAIDEGMKNFHIDLAVLDDGFQVRNLRKDMEIVLLNGTKNKTPNHRLFPSGPCREPLSRIGEADIILVSKGELDSTMRSLTKGKPTFRVTTRPTHLYDVKRDLITHYNFLKGKRIVAFSGLGDNRSFFNLIKEIGGRIVRAINFPDHYDYKDSDIARIVSFKNADLLVTTEKDAVKISCMEEVPENLFYLAIEARIEGEQDLLELIQRKVSSIHFHASNPA